MIQGEFGDNHTEFFLTEENPILPA
uniref:Uncharacterized protein n=1 Tax=Anguilla anguilla TaxID=7936 RepID=A0A0E9TJ16_ANGAN